MGKRSMAISALAGMAIGFMATTASGETRSDIYDPQADPVADIAAALELARAENKRVLIQYGANSSDKCYVLQEHFAEVARVKTYLDAHYIVVLVDNDAHPEVAIELGSRVIRIPHLSVLDAEGKRLGDKQTVYLEMGEKYDADEVLGYLASRSARQGAERSFAKATIRADMNNKYLFVYFGTDKGIWCRRLEEFLASDAAKPLHDTYQFLEIKQDSQPGAVAMRERLSNGEGSGVPWYAVYDIVSTHPRLVATSNDENGKNTGYPINPDEIAHFMSIIESAAGLDDATVASVEEALKARAKEIRAQ